MLTGSLARYGLGTCYLRMSKIRMAEYHYRKAAEIHPNNAVLLGCVGMVRFHLRSNSKFSSPRSQTRIFHSSFSSLAFRFRSSRLSSRTLICRQSSLSRPCRRLPLRILLAGGRDARLGWLCAIPCLARVRADVYSPFFRYLFTLLAPEPLSAPLPRRFSA